MVPKRANAVTEFRPAGRVCGRKKSAVATNQLPLLASYTLACATYAGLAGRRWNGGLMLADLSEALRQIRKAPGFTTTAVITLALGIGATTAIFTLVHQVMLKSLPVTKPEELWRIGDK